MSRRATSRRTGSLNEARLPKKPRGVPEDGLPGRPRPSTKRGSRRSRGPTRQASRKCWPCPLNEARLPKKPRGLSETEIEYKVSNPQRSAAPEEAAGSGRWWPHDQPSLRPQRSAAPEEAAGSRGGASPSMPSPLNEARLPKKPRGAHRCHRSRSRLPTPQRSAAPEEAAGRMIVSFQVMGANPQRSAAPEEAAGCPRALALLRAVTLNEARLPKKPRVIWHCSSWPNPSRPQRSAAPEEAAGRPVARRTVRLRRPQRSAAPEEAAGAGGDHGRTRR